VREIATQSDSGSRHYLTSHDLKNTIVFPPMPLDTKTQPRSFDPPQEPDWHRAIAVAAYYLAQKRGFVGEHSIDDWLAAERQVGQVISPIRDSEVTMSDKIRQKQPKPAAKTPVDTADQPQDVSRFEKFAATQAAGDGIQGDMLKRDKSVDEKIGANMADRK
jgi:hypothetical protein